MTRQLSTLAAPAALAAALFAASSPAAAQDQAGDRVNMVIAYSEDECPEAEEGVITVCQIVVEADRYRIPSNLRTSDSPQNQSQAQKFEKIRYIGEFGIMSCDPAGAGGSLGCTQQMIDAAYAEKEQGSRVRFAQLIEQARQERLSTIDLEAAEMQQRVEAIENEYLERLERERSAPLPGEVEVTAPPVQDPVDAETGGSPD